MKKFLALILSALMLVGVLAGCDSKEEKETTAAPTEVTTKAEAPTSAQNEEQAVLKAASEVEDAQEFYADFNNDLDYDENVFLSGDKSPYPKVEKYYLLEDYKTIADFKKAALSIYSEKTAYEYFFKYSENEADWKISNGPYMIEHEGRAYADVHRFGGGSQLVYDEDSVKVKSIDGDKAVITVKYHYDREPEIIETKEFKMVKENGLWVFDEIVI